MPDELFKKNLNDSGLDRLASDLQYNKKNIPASPKPEDVTTPGPVNIREVLHTGASDIRPIRTFAGDVQEAIDRGKESVVSIKVQEQKRTIENESKAVQRGPIQKKRTSSATLTLVGIIFLIGGVSVLGFIMYQKSGYSMRNVMPPVSVLKGIIIADTDTPFDISSSSKSDLQALLRNEREQSHSRDHVSYIEPVSLIAGIQTKVSAADFLAFIDADAPAQFVRSLKDEFMLGVYSRDEANYPFLILKTDSFNTGLAGMLQWEERLPDILSPLFNGTEETNRSIFIDKIVRNRDVRTLERGKLLYGFLDQNTILITTDDRVFGDIIDAFIAAQAI